MTASPPLLSFDGLPFSNQLPTSYQSAVDFYTALKDIPVHDAASDTWSGVSVLEVHMVPITDLCDDKDIIVNRISTGVLNNIKDMLDKLEQMDQSVGSLLSLEPSKRFKPLRVNLNIYRKNLTSFVLAQKRDLQTALPAFKGTEGAGEDDLISIYQTYINSIFTQAISYYKYLIFREREVNTIGDFLDYWDEASNIAVADYENAIDVEFIFERKRVIVFEINVITGSNVTEHFLEGNPDNEDNLWFNDNANFFSIASQISRLKDFAMANLDTDDKGYLLKINPYNAVTTHRTVAFINGRTISENFVVPRPLQTRPALISATHNSFKFSLDKKNEFVVGASVVIHQRGAAEDIITERDLFFPLNTQVEDIVELEVTGLDLGTVYSFR